MDLTPKQIVTELDKYIIGQDLAKRAVAVALRNRYRRSRLPEELREEITPKNIIMKGPTGVGKTEIARRLAKLVKAPFVKVEATKFTEVGYVGRDVESMVRDLVETSVRLVKEEQLKNVRQKATAVAEKRLVDAILPLKRTKEADKAEAVLREEILQELREGKLNNIQIEIDVEDAPKPMELMPGMGMGMEIDLSSIMGGILPKKKKRRKMPANEAMKMIVEEEAAKLIDNDSVNSEAIKRAENEGIIFIDEIDKIAGGGGGSGPDVSREGVQRDILPIVEGSTVMTKYGAIRTDFILFIAAGAFHVSKIEDLIPELQGRFPVIVELQSLNKEDFVNILTKTENAVTRQYRILLKVDKIDLKFKMDAVEKIAEIAAMQNEVNENIGARRLHTIMEQLLDDISFNAGGDHPEVEMVIDQKYVEQHFNKELQRKNLKKYIL